MKVLVTGGAGFIGTHLVRKLLSEGHEPVVVDNLFRGNEKNLPDSVRLIIMDIRSPEIFSLFRREKFDAVVHLAAQTSVNISMKAPVFDAQENIFGTLNILEALKDTAIKRFVFSSTAAVYGDIQEKDLPVSEDHILQPTSFYGLSKLTTEKYIDVYNATCGLDYVILRFANVFGEFQRSDSEGGVISIFSKQVSSSSMCGGGGGGICIFGNGKQTRDFVYVADVVSAISLALTTNKPNTVYNISTQTETSINQLISLFSRVAKKNVELKYLPERTGDIYRSILSNRRAVSGLNWKPQVSLEEGITNTYKYFLEKNE